jgi:Tol biopolymer transport system component
VVCVACAETTSPRNHELNDAGAPSALIVSDPVPSAPGGTPSSGSSTELVYVSLAPGTLSDVASVRIRNRSTGAATPTVPVVDGGFDPVAIPASAGDELALDFTHTSGAVAVSYVKVPPSRPPRVVRTTPPAGRTDVALGIRPAIIFSEPADPRTLTSATVQLWTATEAVGGEVVVRAAEPWVAEFVPDASLEAGTTYQLVITTDVRDVQGDALEAPFTASFTTAGGGRIAFVSTRDGSPYIYVSNADGSGVTRLASGDAPAWSWDGSRITFQRGRGTAGEIWVMNADGSNQRFVGPGFNPSWSPDGRIAFNSSIWYAPGEPEGGILVMNADGTDVRRILSHSWVKDQNPAPGYGVDAVSEPVWSPDGRQIAFWLYAGYSGTHSVGIMNADGSEPRDLQGHLNWIYFTWGRASWSPDGARIAVSRAFTLAIHEVASGVSGQPFAGGTLPENPDWSPDGTRIVFDRGWVGSPMRRIYVATVGTDQVRQLIPEATSAALADYADYAPAWSRAPK